MASGQRSYIAFQYTDKTFASSSLVNCWNESCWRTGFRESVKETCVTVVDWIGSLGNRILPFHTGDVSFRISAMSIALGFHSNPLVTLAGRFAIIVGSISCIFLK